MEQLNSVHFARDNAIYDNSLYSVAAHRKVESGQSLMAVLKDEALEAKYPDFLSLIQADEGAQNLKALFNAIAGAAKANGADNNVFWLANVTNDKTLQPNFTHSKEAHPHIHIIHGPLPDNYEHKYILQEKTYTPTPRVDFNTRVQSIVAGKEALIPSEDGDCTTYNLRAYAHAYESGVHKMIVPHQYDSFLDFAEKASDESYEGLRNNLQEVLPFLVHEGGARVICDDFNSPGFFNLRIQGGDQEHKWFERPPAPAL